MLIEKNIPSRAGWIEVITGSMFSGKTEELIRRLNRAKIAKQKVEIFKPAMDDRFSEIRIVTHDEHAILSSPVQSASQIVLLLNDVNVVGIDEAQFFDTELVSICNTMANNGIRVIVAGLDMDYSGMPFGPMPNLIAIADDVTKLHAICMDCGDLAHYSFRITKDERQVLIGEKEAYVPLCRKCFLERHKNTPFH
ncbi:MAG: thymidine kinase [Bacteroidales bacterium]